MFKGKYSTLTSHRQMIQDRYRTFSYKKAIEETVQEDDVVIDYGSGSGILSIIAARAGAGKVYAIERNIFTAKFLEHNIKINSLSHRIEIFIGDATDFVIANPNIDVDVIISECIGDHLFENKMIYEFLYLSETYSPRATIPFEMSLCLYQGSIDIRKALADDVLTSLAQNRIKIDLDSILPEETLDIAYLEDYSSEKDPYFNLIDKVEHKNCSELFTFRSLSDLQFYEKDKGIISRNVTCRTSGKYLLFYFRAFLTPKILFHSHPSRPRNVNHSYFQRIIYYPHSYNTINIFLNYLYDRKDNEDRACQNIWIENDI